MLKMPKDYDGPALMDDLDTLLTWIVRDCANAAYSQLNQEQYPLLGTHAKTAILRRYGLEET